MVCTHNSEIIIAYYNNITTSAFASFKDVRAKIFYSIDFFKLLLQIDNDLHVSEMN